MSKTVFLDRDGVINERAAEHNYIKNIGDFTLLPGVGCAIKKLNDSGYRTVIISNQRGIARGMVTNDEVNSIHLYMQELLAVDGARIDDIYICPHNENECSCRKPAIGLFKKSDSENPCAKSLSYMIGDSESDIRAGNSYGIKTILIGDGSFDQNYTVSCLQEAVDIICQENSR